MASSEKSQRTRILTRRSFYRTPVERKKALKKLLTTTQNLNEYTNSESLNKLEGVFQEADKIHNDIPLTEKAINQDEVVLDSEVMTLSSQVIKTCGKKLTKEMGDFSAEDFAEKILRYAEHLPDATLAETNWSLLEQVIPPFKETANFTSLLPHLNSTTQKSANQLKIEEMAARRSQNSQKSQRTRLNLNVPKKKPENVVQLEKDKNAVAQTVHKVDSLIKNIYKTTQKPINYYKLVLDPDFGKTIENMLHVSFLCNDGKIEMTADNEQHLVVIPASKEKKANVEARKVEHQYQHISHLDVETWRFLRNTFQLSEPMINF